MFTSSGLSLLLKSGVHELGKVWALWGADVGGKIMASCVGGRRGWHGLWLKVKCMPEVRVRQPCVPFIACPWKPQSFLQEIAPYYCSVSWPRPWGQSQTYSPHFPHLRFWSVLPNRSLLRCSLSSMFCHLHNVVFFFSPVHSSLSLRLCLSHFLLNSCWTLTEELSRNSKIQGNSYNVCKDNVDVWKLKHDSVSHAMDSLDFINISPASPNLRYQPWGWQWE